MAHSIWNKRYLELELDISHIGLPPIQLLNNLNLHLYSEFWHSSFLSQFIARRGKGRLELFLKGDGQCKAHLE